MLQISRKAIKYTSAQPLSSEASAVMVAVVTAATESLREAVKAKRERNIR